MPIHHQASNRHQGIRRDKDKDKDHSYHDISNRRGWLALQRRIHLEETKLIGGQVGKGPSGKFLVVKDFEGI